MITFPREKNTADRTPSPCSVARPLHTKHVARELVPVTNHGGVSTTSAAAAAASDAGGRRPTGTAANLELESADTCVRAWDDVSKREHQPWKEIGAPDTINEHRKKQRPCHPVLLVRRRSGRKQWHGFEWLSARSRPIGTGDAAGHESLGISPKYAQAPTGTCRLLHCSTWILATATEYNTGTGISCNQKWGNTGIRL